MSLIRKCYQTSGPVLFFYQTLWIAIGPVSSMQLNKQCKVEKSHLTAGPVEVKVISARPKKKLASGLACILRAENDVYGQMDRAIRTKSFGVCYSKGGCNIMCPVIHRVIMWSCTKESILVQNRMNLLCKMFSHHLLPKVKEY